MSALTDILMDNIRTRLPGALDGMIRHEMFFVADEFCRTSYAYRQIAEVSLAANTTVYQLSLGADLVTTLYVEHPSLDTSNAIIDYTQKLVSLAQAPTTGDLSSPMFVNCVLAPTPDASAPLDTLLPDEIWARWHETIKDGVLGRMMGQPSKPYSNTQMAAFHLKRFRNGMAMARHLTNTGHIPGGQVWRFPSWA